MNQNRTLADRLLAPLSLVSALIALTSSASAQNLGAASNYNYFVFGNVTLSNTDVEGRAAIGGNASFTNYGVGDKLPSSSAYSLVVDGNLSFTNGQVFQGNAIVGGSTSLSGFNMLNGTLSQGDLLDFAAAKNSLGALSDSLAGNGANSSYALNYGNLIFTGTNAELNTFTINANDFTAANSIAINAIAGSTVVINVSGSSINFDYLGINITGTDKSRVLYNFYEADVLNIAGISVLGSILAPDAAVNFSNGNVEGTLVSNSLTGSGEFHHSPFQGKLPTTVPEPSAFALVGAMGALLLVRRKR